LRRGSSSYPVKPQKKSQTKDDSAESSEGTAVSKKEKEVASSEGGNDSASLLLRNICTQCCKLINYIAWKGDGKL
jgi:hypothetical protein